MENTENIQPPGTPPVALQRACSAESDLWHEYLRSERYTGYQGTCKCWSCQAIRDNYENWKTERARRMQPNIGSQTQTPNTNQL